MRIAVRCPDDHPVSPGAVFAYRLGRVEDGVHNRLAHMDEPIPLEEFLTALVDRAKAEFPGHTVTIERLVQKPDVPGESMWVAAEDAEQHEPTPAGEIKATEVSVVASSQAAPAPAEPEPAPDLAPDVGAVAPEVTG